MPETKKEQEARFRDFIQIGQDGLKDLGIDDDETPSPEKKRKQEDESATLFERMSSAELMQLYQSDRAKWQEVMDSVLSAGERKLAKLNGR